MYGKSASAQVGMGGVLLSGSFYICPTVECILCNETVYMHCTLHEAVSGQAISKPIPTLQY